MALSFIQLGGTLILAILGGVYEFRNFWRRRDERDSGPTPDAPPLVSSARDGEEGGRRR